MRLFLGGSEGLVLWEHEEITPLYDGPVLCTVKASATRLVAGTETGAVVVFEANNGGAEIAAKDVGSGIHALGVTNKGHVLTGPVPAGVWLSKDLGHDWAETAFASSPGNEGWHSPWGTPLVSAIATHPKDPKTLYCGVEAGGLYRSRDRGSTWTDLALPCADVHSIQLSPSKPERVYVTTGVGVFTSDDEGFSWRAAGVRNAARYTMGLDVHPTEADRVIVSAAQGPQPMWAGDSGAVCDVYLSTDAGHRFRTVARGLRGAVQRRALIINQKVPSEVVFGTSIGELYYSNDGGESFDLRAKGLGDLKTVTFA